MSKLSDMRFDEKLVYQLIEPKLKELIHETTIERRKEVRAVYAQRSNVPVDKHA